MSNYFEKRRTVVKPTEVQRYFVWIKNTRGGVDPQIWFGDKLKGTGERQNGSKKPFDEANPGDLVGFYYMEDSDPSGVSEAAKLYPWSIVIGVDLAKPGSDMTVGIIASGDGYRPMTDEELKQTFKDGLGG